MADVADAERLGFARPRTVARRDLDVAVGAAERLLVIRRAVPQFPDVVALTRPAEARHVEAPLPIARIAVIPSAAVVRSGFALRRRERARRRRLADHVSVRDLIVPDDVRAVFGDVVLPGEVLHELRARGVLGLGVALVVVADVLDADGLLVVVPVAGVPRGVALVDELPDATVLADDVLHA